MRTRAFGFPASRSISSPSPACTRARLGGVPAPFLRDSVRQQLGHDDYKSIEAYIALVRNEELAMRG